jgi:hypothetical protein
MDTDDCWERYVVNPPPGAVVVEMNYRDAIACGWWNDEQEQLRQYSLIYEKADYDNIWEGKPSSSSPAPSTPPRSPTWCASSASGPCRTIRGCPCTASGTWAGTT